jgi:hypothetical protein
VRVCCRWNLFTEQLPSDRPGIVDVFTGRYQATDGPSCDRCLAMILHGARHAACRRHFMCREIWIPLRVILFYSALPCQEFALKNASRTGADDFDATECSRMNTCSARDYTMRICKASVRLMTAGT